MRINDKMSVVKYRKLVTGARQTIHGVSIPEDLAAAAGIKPGDLVKITQGASKVVISKVRMS